MKVVKTNERVTRYVAFDNPGSFVENELDVKSGGIDYAVFYEPTHNVVYPHIKDGIYCSIASYQGKECIVDCHATEPNKGRKQHGFCERYATYEEAKSVVMKWIPKAQGIVKNSIQEGQLVLF